MDRLDTLAALVRRYLYSTDHKVASSGWTSSAPLAVLARDGQTFWLVGMLLVIMSSLLGAINFITTIVQLRAPGLTWFRLPFFVWSQFIAAWLLLFASPALQAAAVLQGMDRVANTSFFLPSGLVVSGQTLNAAGGGSALLWQHLFWFLEHPRSMSSCCRRWVSSPRSSRTTRASLSGATA